MLSTTWSLNSPASWRESPVLCPSSPPCQAGPCQTLHWRRLAPSRGLWGEWAWSKSPWSPAATERKQNKQPMWRFLINCEINNTQNQKDSVLLTCHCQTLSRVQGKSAIAYCFLLVNEQHKLFLFSGSITVFSFLILMHIVFIYFSKICILAQLFFF